MQHKENKCFLFFLRPNLKVCPNMKVYVWCYIYILNVFKEKYTCHKINQ